MHENGNKPICNFKQTKKTVYLCLQKLLTFVEEDINAYEGWVRQNMLQNPIVRQIQDEKKFEHIYVL